MHPPRPALASLFAALSLLGAPVLAQSPPAPPATPAPPAPASADDAKTHFERGVDFYDRHELDAALAEFLRSRKLQPTRRATKNAALCLDELKRRVEALEMFEELARRPDLPSTEVKLARDAIERLKKEIGVLDIHEAEQGATIVIDGRVGGVTPVAQAIRVAAGSHVVRVYKEGFEAFEKQVDVAGAQTIVVSPHLVRLEQAGRLFVVASTGKALDVVVDDIVVGRTPWEGSLSPGEHTVYLRGAGDLGTQPALAPVRVNDVTAISLVVEELAVGLRVQPTPAGASIAIDGVGVGRGLWEGRLRAGPHRIEVAANGFLPQARDVTLLANEAETVRIALERDPASPLWGWRRGPFFEADAAFGAVTSFGGDVAGGCTAGCSRLPGFGFMVLGRGGYRSAADLLVDIDAGYILVVQRVSNRNAALLVGPKANGDPGKADDTLHLGGALVGASVGFRLGSSFPLTLRLGAGALLGALGDHRTGTFTTQDPLHPIRPFPVNATFAPPTAIAYLAPEVRFSVRVSRQLEVSTGVAALVLFSPSPPTWTRDDLVGASTDGAGRFTEALTSRAMVVLLPGVAARTQF